MLSHCRLVAMSHCRIAAMSYCRFVAMSHCCIAAMSHCRIVALSQCRNDALSSVATVKHFPQPQLFAQENSKHGAISPIEEIVAEADQNNGETEMEKNIPSLY